METTPTDATSMDAPVEPFADAMIDAARDTDGDLVGLDAIGRDSSTPSDAGAPPDPHVLALSVGKYGTCAIDREHRLYCWGLRLSETPSRVADWTDVTAVDVGTFTQCAIRGGSELWCWGSGSALGTTPVTTPRRFASTWPAPLSQLAVGSSAICALTGDGVRCWGDGVLALGSDGAAPIGELADTIALAVSESFACAVDRAGALRCWGNNLSGQLGDGSTVDRRRPALVSGIGTVTGVQVGVQSTCATTAPGPGYCWGFNDPGNVGDGTRIDRSAPSRVLEGDYRDLTQGWYHGAGVGLDGTVFEWGSLRGTPDRVLVPRAVPATPRATMVEAGQDHTCALGVDGEVYCWGALYLGRPGGASEEALRVSFPCEPACGVGSTCTDGACVPDRPPPVPLDAGVEGARVVSIAETCAAHASGQVTCWGPGFLGDGSPEVFTRTTPRFVSDITDGIEVAHVSRASCARRSDGSVWCWGANTDGELGDGTFAERRAPVRVVDLPPVSRIIAMLGAFAAVDGSGDVWVWGNDGVNFARASGGGARRNRPIRVVGVTDVTDVGRGPCLAGLELHGWAALDTSGAMHCWAGGAMPLETVVADPTLRMLTRSAWSSFGCALGDELRCWGTVPGHGPAALDVPISGYRAARAVCDAGGELVVIDSFGDTLVDGRLSTVPPAVSCSETCVITEAGEAWCRSSLFWTRVRTF